jgi:hypothetical protein
MDYLNSSPVFSGIYKNSTQRSEMKLSRNPSEKRSLPTIDTKGSRSINADDIYYKNLNRIMKENQTVEVLRVIVRDIG